MAQINIGGTKAVQLKGYTDASITSDQTFTFPSTGGELVTNASGGGSGSGASAWGNVNSDGTKNGGGFNFADVSRASEGVYDITFTTPMPNDQYSVTASVSPLGSGNQPVRLITAGQQSTTGFRVITTNGGSIQDGTNADVKDYPFTFAVFASSTVTPTFTWKRDGTTVELANAGDGLSAGNGNMTVNGDGAILVNRDTGTKDVIAGQLNGATTSHIYADGSATFASFVEAKGGVYGSRDSSSQLAYVGRVTGGATTFQVTAGGVITAANVAFNLDPDNSANYVSTTNADGETEQVYSGPQLDVKALLLEFQSKIETLEAAKSALEARISTLEGGAS